MGLFAHYGMDVVFSPIEWSLVMGSLIRSATLSVFAVFTLAACGGGGGGGGAAGTPPPVTVNADPGGIWYGFAHNTTLGESIEVVGVSISNGELRFIDDQGVQYHGSLQVSGNSYTASFRAIAPLGEYFLNGSSVLTGSMTGTISERNALEGSYIMSSGERGTVSLLYDNLYQRPSDLSRLAGTWIDAYSEVISVDSMGRIFAQDSGGCVYNGTAAVVDARYNAYRINLTVSNCGNFNGAYSGLGVLDDWQANGDNRLLIIQLSNQVWSLTASFGKL